MSGRGRKYNIWIAYSDLFTNLSTFLFISALGVFAAIGSGILAPPGMGGTRPCAVPKSLRASMEGGNSLLKKAEVKVEALRPEERCTEYYPITEFRFRPPNPTQLTSESGVPATAEDYGRICTPLWMTLMRNEFEQADGRLTLVGIAEADPNGQYPASCGAFQRGPQIDGLPTTISTIETIRRCRGRDGLAAYKTCVGVENCLKSPPNKREDWCRDLVAEYDRHRLWAANCAKNSALAQALQVYDRCERAPEKRGFPTYDFDASDMVSGANRRDRRRLSWRRVVFDAISRDGLGQDLPASHPLAAAPTGSVLVRVQYGR